jgi:hypothetical protein
MKRKRGKRVSLRPVAWALGVLPAAPVVESKIVPAQVLEGLREARRKEDEEARKSEGPGQGPGQGQ